jgi:hypothetical protein
MSPGIVSGVSVVVRGIYGVRMSNIVVRERTYVTGVSSSEIDYLRSAISIPDIENIYVLACSVCQFLVSEKFLRI